MCTLTTLTPKDVKKRNLHVANELRQKLSPKKYRNILEDQSLNPYNHRRAFDGVIEHYRFTLTNDVLMQDEPAKILLKEIKELFSLLSKPHFGPEIQVDFQKKYNDVIGRWIRQHLFIQILNKKTEIKPLFDNITYYEEQMAELFLSQSKPPIFIYDLIKNLEEYKVKAILFSISLNDSNIWIEPAHGGPGVAIIQHGAKKVPICEVMHHEVARPEFVTTIIGKNPFPFDYHLIDAAWEFMKHSIR